VRARRVLGFLLVPTAVVAGALHWALATGHRSEAPKRPPAEAAAKGLPGAPMESVAVAIGEKRTHDLVETYVRSAGDPKALAARKLALSALLNEDNVPKKLSLVLEALARDPTPPDHDPLWQYAAENLARVWQGDTLTRGLDLMVAETRPRAQEALISSFSHLVLNGREEELTNSQRQTLTNYFIDLYQKMPERRQQEVDQALRRVASDDVADIMLGKGKNGEELAGERAYREALEDAQRVIAQGPAPPPEPEAAVPPEEVE
jgi:hypothetical protein